MSGNIPLPATPIDLPLLPLRDVVVFPHMVIPLFVGRPKSIKALEAAMEAERRIMLVAQKTAAKDEPAVSDMFEVGCVSTILQMLKLPDGTVKVLVEGQQRASVNRIDDGESHFTATVTPLVAAEGVRCTARSRPCAARSCSSSTSTSNSTRRFPRKS
jgi:ATP-dependent Lon protease